nr:hypothetical protein [Tanacetum cinerariifolium]
MEGNKSIQRSDEQRNLYKALVEAYESNKIILDIYEETVTLKRHHDDDADKDEEPSAGPDRGLKRRREGKEPESASAPMEIATRSAGRSSGVNVSTLSRLIRKLEKSKGLAQSYSNHDPEMVVSVVEKTIQDAERLVQLVDLQHLCQTLDVRALPSER